MRFIITLILALTVTWLSLSGYFKPMLLTLGVISIAFVVWLCKRMKIMDVETAPYETTPRVLRYFIWLFAQIVKANMQVVKAVLNPNLEISPTLVKVAMPQKTDIGRTMFANSITLTPGTVSVDMDGDGILVHALLAEMSDPSDFEDMGQRSAWSIGEIDNLSRSGA
ncbi:MAG: Na+/H+ antiporter subunit E [Litorimonas sp.]